MKKYFGWITAIGLFLLSKAKWLLVILKVGKFATLISMFISLAAYAMFYGWKFAYAIIYLIFVHEMGHLAAARIKKLKTSPAIFIPFLGAAIGLKEKPKDAKTEAFIAYGGPLAGLLSIIPAIILFWLTEDPYWGLVIQLGALINLFNLFPVSPLDGGRIVTVLSTKLWFVGLLVIFAFLFLSPDPILILIFIFGLLTWWKRVREGYEIRLKEEELQVLTNYQRDIDEITDALFLQLSQDGIIDSYDPYINNKLMRLKREIPEDMERKFHIPFFHDERKAKVHGKNLKKKKLQILFSALENSDVLYKLGSIQEKTVKEILGTQKEIRALRKYYVTDNKTKIVVLVCYLLLAVILAFLLVYGLNILESYPVGR